MAAPGLGRVSAVRLRLLRQGHARAGGTPPPRPVRLRRLPLYRQRWPPVRRPGGLQQSPGAQRSPRARRVGRDRGRPERPAADRPRVPAPPHGPGGRAGGCGCGRGRASHRRGAARDRAVDRRLCRRRHRTRGVRAASGRPAGPRRPAGGTPHGAGGRRRGAARPHPGDRALGGLLDQGPRRPRPARLGRPTRGHPADGPSDRGRSWADRDRLPHPATLEGQRRGRPWQAEATLYRGGPPTCAGGGRSRCCRRAGAPRSRSGRAGSRPAGPRAGRRPRRRTPPAAKGRAASAAAAGRRPRPRPGRRPRGR